MNPREKMPFPVILLKSYIAKIISGIGNPHLDYFNKLYVFRVWSTRRRWTEEAIALCPKEPAFEWVQLSLLSDWSRTYSTSNIRWSCLSSFAEIKFVFPDDAEKMPIEKKLPGKYGADDAVDVRVICSLVSGSEFMQLSSLQLRWLSRKWREFCTDLWRFLYLIWS